MPRSKRKSETERSVRLDGGRAAKRHGIDEDHTCVMPTMDQSGRKEVLEQQL
jgi:hypothetical protein